MKFTEWGWLFFVAGAFLSWGCYVPTLHEGQTALGGGLAKNGPLRAFLLVGVAYFVTAVVIPGILIWLGHEPASFNVKGTTFAFFGGVLGAAGALCIIFSLRFGGTPMYVAPLVFAGAPIINAIVTRWWHPTGDLTPGPMYYIGIVLAALGAGMVLFEKGSLEDRARKLKASQAQAAATAPVDPSAPKIH